MNCRNTILLVFLMPFISLKTQAQDSEMQAYKVEQLEMLTEKKEADPTDDSYALDLDFFSKHPLNLNTATAEDLIQLHLLQTMQIGNFISYRKLLGPLITIHELQAVPGWDVETIHRLLPYVVIGRDESLYSAVRERWKGGDASLLLRAAQVMEKSKGFQKPVNPEASFYEGTAQKIFLRYTYNYKNLLAFGFTGQKDAGEPFLRGAQRYGFDFYSFHFFLRQAGWIKCLAIGDFTVNLGQGLIQWQTMAFSKSSQAMGIKREASVIRPYHSAGEYNFHRGAAISLQHGKWEGTVFVSSQKISTNTEPDTTGRKDLFSSFQNSGYHRTPAEIADRYNSQQFSAGGNIRYSGRQWMAGFNMVHFEFSRPFKKREEPYNLYSLKGKRLTDISFDYNYTLGNLHLFGEFAADHGRHLALIQGALISLTENLDMSFLYRNISKGFQSLYSDAFTENSLPNNERGWYTGVAYRPFAGIQLDIYYDLFEFSWLKYRVDAPSRGRDVFIQCVYQPNKWWSVSALYKNERKEGNADEGLSATHGIAMPVKQRWRIQTDCTITKTYGFTGRMEFIDLTQALGRPQKGFLGEAGFSFHQKIISGNIAAAVFETDGYDTRLYLYEQDLLYNFSLPAYYGKGLHYFLNLHKDFSRMIHHAGSRFRLSCWVKWGQTFYPGTTTIGSGLDEIKGNRKSELKAQVLLRW